MTTLKEIVEKIHMSTPASTWSTPTSSLDQPGSAPVSPQVLSDPDDMVNTSKCIDSVCVYPCGERFFIQFLSTHLDCTHKLENSSILHWIYTIHDGLGNAMMTPPNFSCYDVSL